MKKLLLFIALFIGMSLQAQTIKVKGEVSDGNDPLPGVNVQVRGEKLGTITDINGAFTLDLQNGDQLTLSYIGFKTITVSYKGEKTLRIVMKEDATELSETVVVGYATQKKATLTGAVSAVSGETVTKRSVASLSTALEGTMPGVTVQQTSGEPGADGSTIRIRGLGSVNSSLAPLVLVDGIEMDINQVDMNTVESVSVLKDAASASIYGSRSSNGVILITTKRGKEGKVKVNYSGYVTMQRPTNMPEVVSAAEYLKAELKAKDNAEISVTPDQRQQTLDLIEQYNLYKADNWNRYDTNWREETMSNQSFMHSHNVSVSGGNSNIQYYGSGSYLGQDGLIPNNSFSRTNIRGNMDAQLTRWAKFSMETNIRQSNTINPGLSSAKSIINQSLFMLPTLSAARELDGNWGYGKNGMNPTATAYASGQNKAVNSEVLLNGTLTITPIKNWEIIGQYSYRSTTSRTRVLITPYNTSLKGVDMGRYPADDKLTEGFGETIRNYYRAQTSYGDNIGKFFLKGMVGFQAEDNTYANLSGSKSGFDLGKYFLDNGDGSTASASGGAYDWAMMSFFGRINFNYDEKYLLEINGRYDGSSRFTPANRWGFFPSASAGWVISREGFMKDAEHIVDILKIRGSYGLLGNQEVGNYPYAATIETGYGYWFDRELSSGVAQVYLANENIKWEKSRQANIGIDLSMWNGMLSLTADYYQKDVYDMLLRMPNEYYVGIKNAFSNVGSMTNKGWEITVGHKNKIGDFSYGINVTLSDSRNKILDLRGNNSQDKTQVEGYPINGLWGYLTDGYYQDYNDVANSPKLSSAARPGFVKYVKVYEGEGVDPLLIDSRDMVFLGDPFPHYEYGINLNAAWKGIDLSIFIQGVGERSVYMSGIGLKPFANGSNLFKHQLDSWTADNPNAAYPLLMPENNSADNFVKSDKWIKDGSYARLKNVVIGYTIPARATKKCGIESLRLYISGQNLFTLSNFYKGYDPEVQYGGNVGGEFYPIMQTFTFGLDLKF